MNKWKLYKLIRQNESLSNIRHPMFEKNRFMKFLAWFMILYYAALLIFAGVSFPMAFKGAYHGVASFHVLDGAFLWLLFADFWIRFPLQQTPVQAVKPYRLLPINRKFLTHIFLLRSGFSLGNLFWCFFLVPFGLLSVWPLLGWWSFVGWLVGWWMLCIANGFAYLFIRTICMRHLAWIIVPILVHTSLILLMVLPDHNVLDIPCTEFLYQFALGNPLVYIATAGLIALGYYANLTLHSRMAFDDVAKVEEVTHASKMAYLDRYGTLGEYMKLEIKLHLRNKQVRMQLFTLLGLILLLSSLLYFTDVYDEMPFMKSFILLYDFVGLGTARLITIMCFEGNYIDGLMSRRESIYDLLRAKYYFNLLIAFVPLLVVIPLAAIGKFTIWMLLGYFFINIGVLTPLIFQLAVYNNNTIPLNQKLMGKQGNATQQIVSVVILFLPIGLEYLCVWIMGPVWGYTPMIVLGIIGVAIHPFWLRNIYKRFMQRRYINMENFRASRNS